MGFETQRHRGTQRSGGIADKSCEGASKSVGIHIVSVPVRPERTFPAAGMQFWNLSIPVVLP
jgi:hypothetical protein